MHMQHYLANLTFSLWCHFRTLKETMETRRSVIFRYLRMHYRAFQNLTLPSLRKKVAMTCSFCLQNSRWTLGPRGCLAGSSSTAGRHSASRKRDTRIASGCRFSGKKADNTDTLRHSLRGRVPLQGMCRTNS